MIRLIVEISKYVLLILMLLFTIYTYRALGAKNKDKRDGAMRAQLVLMVLFNFAAYAVLFIQTYDVKILFMYAGVIAYILLTYLIYHIFYKGASFVLVNTMCMMISIGLVIHTRLDIEMALKQLIIAAAATVISFVIPIIIRKARVFSKWGLFFAVIGILLLAAVFVLARVTGGGKLSIEFHGITFQFSEFVKITFVFFVAGMLMTSKSLKQVFIVTVLAGIHVIILVASTDLGAALVYFVAYMVMVCVATGKVRYAALGIGGMAAASVAAYKLFSHVRVRVQVWRDPFTDYQGTGYQIVQALFSVVAGGWFGTGLLKGSPDMIPLVQQDFTFAAICEELGILFGICLILLCMGLYLVIVNIAVKLDNDFYKLIAIGLGTEYAFQVFLTIGGTTKLIPMTGITLPLVSYGGSSLTCTIFMLAIVQGLYILRTDQEPEMTESIPAQTPAMPKAEASGDLSGARMSKTPREPKREAPQRNSRDQRSEAPQRNARDQRSEAPQRNAGYQAFAQGSAGPKPAAGASPPQGAAGLDKDPGSGGNNTVSGEVMEDLERRIWEETEHSINR